MADAPAFDPGRLGWWLRTVREGQGLSQEWVADKASSVLGRPRPLTKQAISQFENETTVPDEETLRGVMRALGQADADALVNEWWYRRETERLRAEMKTRGIASDEDVDAIIRVLRGLRR